MTGALSTVGLCSPLLGAFVGLGALGRLSVFARLVWTGVVPAARLGGLGGNTGGIAFLSLDGVLVVHDLAEHDRDGPQRVRIDLRL